MNIMGIVKYPIVAKEVEIKTKDIEKKRFIIKKK